jgi:hypothetical protein
MLDLYNKKYDRKTLKDNIYMLNMLDVLKTQHIDVTFAVRYILNPKYQLNEDEQQITPNMVLIYQKHITREELQREMISYDSDDDSIDDFETVSNRI